MKVRMYSLKERGVVELGAIVLKDGCLVTDPPDSLPLQNLLSHPLHPWHPTKRLPSLYATKAPEQYLRMLPEIYIGTYCWAGPLEE